MATITTINGSDVPKNSRTTINDNFSNLNTSKIDSDGSVSMAAALPMGGYKITGLGTPTSATDATTKNYVDGLVGSTTSILSYGAVGDGVTDDTSAIQSALNAINTAGGGVLVIPEGTYLITNTLTVYANTVLQGVGFSSVIDAKMATAKDAISFNSSATGVILRDFKLSCNRATHSTDDGVMIKGSNHLIEHVYVENAGNDNFYCYTSASNITIDRCISVGADRNGIAVGDSCSYIKITNNYVSGAGAGGVGPSINLIGAGIIDSLVSHNITVNGAGDSMTGYNPNNKRISYTCNVGYNPGNNGIHSGGDDILIEGNIFYSPTNRGIYHVNSDVSKANRITIVGNHVWNNGNYNIIELNNVDYSNISGNHIYGSAQHGILLADCIIWTINGNEVSQSTNDGIRITDSQNGVVSGNTSYSNVGNGIHGDGTTTVATISGNMSRSNAGWGILTEDSSNRWCVVGNTAYANTAGTISLTGANNVNANNLTS